MLSTRQEKLIRSLLTKKGRTESGFCLVEGKKNIKEAGEFIEFTFTEQEAKHFSKLVSTVTPQSVAAVARIPTWNDEAIMSSRHIVVLDGVQDPGNVGTILRLCLGFEASLVLIESADPTNPKVVRASAGAFFQVPWVEVSRAQAVKKIISFKRPVVRLENKGNSKVMILNQANSKKLPKKLILIAGSEGKGILLKIAGTSLAIQHNQKLESLNVASALAIILAQLY